MTDDTPRLAQSPDLQDVIEQLQDFSERYLERNPKMRGVIATTIAALAPGNTDEQMARLSASEVACYRWPEDTAEHRAMRAAFMDGVALADGNDVAVEATDAQKLRSLADIFNAEIEKVEAAPVEAWQPIETAPKDGTPVLVAYYMMFEPGVTRQSVCWNVSETWCGGPSALNSFKPTHWMPLPAATLPATQGDGE
jgi:hypothetical protein